MFVKQNPAFGAENRKWLNLDHVAKFDYTETGTDEWTVRAHSAFGSATIVELVQYGTEAEALAAVDTLLAATGAGVYAL